MDSMDFLNTTGANTRAYYYNGKGRHLKSPAEAIEAADASEKRGVLVVENISPLWMQAFESEWGVEPGFFKEYKANPQRDGLWDRIFEFREPALDRSQLYHVKGVLEYGNWVFEDINTLDTVGYIKRHLWQPEGPYPVSSYTCISYCRPLEKSNICTFLASDLVLCHVC
jgi:hypothetical protein